MIKYLTIILMVLFSVQLMADYQNNSSAVLYYSPTCGHCKKVLAWLEQEHKSVAMVNVKESSGSAEYSRLGVSSVPVLVINGQILQGSDTIISYFKQHPEVLR